MHRSLIAQSFTYEPTRDVLYLNNAKSGCSTIKNTILMGLQQEQDPQNTSGFTPQEIHGQSKRWGSDYSAITPEKTFSFSVVRNPFARILSSFLDKIGNQNLLRKQFYWQQGLPAGKDTSLVEFLTLLKNSKALFDQHWRPQVANLYVGFVPLDEVHFLESLDSTQSSVCERLAGVESFVKRSPHGTHAHTKVAEHINDEAQALIVELYKEDFETFGYSTDSKDVADAPAGILSLPAKTPLLTDMLARMSEKHTAKDGFVQSLHALGIADISRNVAPKDTAVWRDWVAKEVTSDSPARKYLALSIVIGAGKPYFDDDFVMQCFVDIVQMAPYQIGNHANLIKRLGAQGRFEEARIRAEALLDMTWQKPMVKALLQGLEDMQKPAAAS